MSESELMLISESLAGDPAAFDRLYAEHAARVRAYLLRCGFASADADDLLQKVFVRAFKSLATFDTSRGRFGQWIGGIARNVVRRAWSRRKEPESFDPELAEATLVDEGDSPEDASVAREETRAVARAVEHLPPELAAIVRLRYVEGRTTRGVAAATGIPESTVRLRLDEARGRLSDLLRAEGIVA